MDDVQMICQLIGCTQEEASQALLKHETLVDAIDSLLPPAPVVSGSKYIPPKPIVDSGLSAEQKELCERGRWLQDKVNAVFSVAHSQTRTLPAVEDCSSSAVPPSSPESAVVLPVCEPPDVAEKMTQ